MNKFVEIETMDDLSVQNFIDELKSLKICDKITTSTYNTQESYEIFSKLLKYANEKHLPKKIVKYNKKKHKQNKWMTNSILKSINMKDKMYTILIQSDQQDADIYQALKHEFKMYRATLRRSIREAKRLYYFRIFNTFKKDIKKHCPS